MIHFQRSTNGWDEALLRLPNGSLFKCIDQGQEFALVKSVAAQRGINISTCLRHHYDHAQVFGGTYEQNKQRARDFFATFIDVTFIDQYATHCDYIEEWNEYLASSQNATEVQERVTWARAAADVWLNEYRTNPRLAHVKLVLCNAPIGNWIHRDFAVIASTYDCAMGYHPYTGWGFDSDPGTRWGEDHHLDNGVQDTLDWLYLSGLWDSMEYDWGIDVEWLFTEAGPFESAVDGWKSSACLGGDRSLYVAAMRDWIRDVQQTPAYAEGRIVGFAPFTTGRAGSTWEYFWTEQPELNMLADMFAQEWHPGTYVPPIPPDPPSECRGLPRVQYNRVYVAIHESLSTNEAVAIFREAWERGRETVGGSFDDAGIGDLNNRLVRIHGLPQSEELTYANWFNQWYPGTNIEFVPPMSILAWPLPGKPVQTVYEDWAIFNAPRDYNDDGVAESRHEGLDMYATLGDSVAAALSGEVIWASDNKQGTSMPSRYGKHIVIAHGNGLHTWYCHLNDMLSAVGDIVETGDIIGYAGNSSTVQMAVHLHFNVQRIGNGLDGYAISDVVGPAPYLGL